MKFDRNAREPMRTDVGAPASRGASRVSDLTRPLCLAAVVFAFGIAVYVLDRPAGTAYLLPRWLEWHRAGAPLFGAVGEWLPSFAHALFFTVLTAAVLPASRWRPWLAVALWCALGSALEIGQHPALSSAWVAALPHWFAKVPVLDHLGAYWRTGGFGLDDLAASAVGCVLATVLVHFTSRSRSRAHGATQENRHVDRV